MVREKVVSERFNNVKVIKDIFEGNESCSCGKVLTIETLLFGDIKGTYKCSCGDHYFVCNDEKMKLYSNYSYDYNGGFIVNKDSFYGVLNKEEDRFLNELEVHREMLYIDIKTIDKRKRAEFSYLRPTFNYFIDSKEEGEIFFEDFTVEDLMDFSKELKRLCAENKIKPNYGELMESYCSPQNLYNIEEFFQMIFGDLFFELLVKNNFKNEIMHNPLFSVNKIKKELRIKEDETSLSKMIGIPSKVLKSYIGRKDIVQCVQNTKSFFVTRNLQEYEVLVNKYEFPLDSLSHARDLLDNGYGVEKLGKYIIDRCNEEKLNKKGALRILDDLCRMSKSLQIDFRPYSRRLRHRHNIVAERYNKVTDEKNRVGLQIATDKIEIKQVSDKYVAKLLRTPEDFTYEGDAQRNCVASYIYKVVDFGEIIFSVRAVENLEKPLATVEVKNNKIVQAKGFANSKLDDEIKLYLRKLAFANEWC